MEIQHTLVLVNSRFCSLTACLKNEKCNRTKCNLWRNGEIQAKTKIQSAFLEVMEKYQNTKVQSNYKKDKINMHAIAQKYKMQKKYEQTTQKIHNRKTYKPKISNIQNTNKIQIQNEPGSQPHVHFEKQEPTCRINAKPTCCIFKTLQFRFCIFQKFLSCIFSYVFYFFVFLISLQKTLL